MSEVGDITEIIRPVDLQDVGALSLTVSPGFHQPHNPSHAPTPDQRSDAKLPLRHPHPQSPGSPEGLREATSPILDVMPARRPRRHGSYAEILGKSPFTMVRRNGVDPHPLDPVVSCS